ncbi:uncharacterized protein BXZ73DRAFT_80158 [Epithele typhae]|uniref:uncharacterized protein n=1 Tax=Epithele typhae TaxID=378194 RepID=UPI0020077630|nr:uncharacterized protein BXZ73DRAFT_80158 [Epithele typhae]KAH9920206.1 hypothetical protein BXZ73DRAFT_80158 [Epithele typhae]
MPPTPRILPPELMLPILELACIDGGYTGSSLALTSHEMRELSRPSRFHSVQLSLTFSRTKLALLLRAFEAQLAYSAATGSPAPRIRHLHVAAACANPSRPSSNEVRDYKEQLEALFTLAAPHLHTLSLAGAPAAVGSLRAWPLPAALGTTTAFPHLRELTVVGETKLSFTPRITRRDDAPAAADAEFAPLPRLTHLHVPGYNGTADLAAWARRAPGVTHLRVSEVDRSASYALCPAMCAMLGAGPSSFADWRRNAGAAPVFAHLRAFLLQPSARGIGWLRGPGCGFGSDSMGIEREFGEELQDMHARASRSWCLVPSRPYSRGPNGQEYILDEVLRAWRERLEGGPGFWKTETSWWSRGEEGRVA